MIIEKCLNVCNKFPDCKHYVTKYPQNKIHIIIVGFQPT
jgi:hypothetical protein